MKNFQIGILGIIFLVLLRLGIGWHFYREGSKKLDSGKFAATGFLTQATGPLAGFYHGMIPDYDGTVRLDEIRTIKEWEFFRDRLANHYGFDEKQKKQATAKFLSAKAGLVYWFEEHDEDLIELRNEQQRLVTARQDAVTRDVNYRADWIVDKERELTGKRNAMLGQLDKLWSSYEDQLNGIATAEQLAARGRYELKLPGEGTLSATKVSRIIPWFTLVVGVCLLLGLFTRVASVAGALFLFSVIMTQPPWAPDAADTFAQSVEMLALLALAATGAAGYFGIDYLIKTLYMGCCGARTQGGKA